jgi:hypothetical protein
MSSRPPQRDRWASRSKGHRIIVLVVMLILCALDILFSWVQGSGSGDALTGAIGVVGIVLFSTALIATLRE